MISWRVSQLARGVLGAAMVASLYVFLFGPLAVVVGASFDASPNGFMNFPPRTLSLTWYGAIDARLWQTLQVSLLLGAVTAIASMLLGTLAALGLVRGRMPGREFVAALFRAPLQVPHVVTGVGLLQLYYIVADALALGLLGTFHGLALGHVFMATPYVVGSVGASLLRYNPRLDEAAFSLGANRWRAFRRVTLPLIMPGIYAGGLYAFIVSFGDVPVSLFLASPANTTFPVELFYSMEYDFKPSILAISTLILIGSFVVLWLVQRAAGLDALMRSGN